MSIRGKILQKTENTPDGILSEVLDYLQYLKVKHQQGMMETALLSETIYLLTASLRANEVPFVRNMTIHSMR